MWTVLGFIAVAIVPHVLCNLVNISPLPTGCPNKTQQYLTDFGYLDPARICTQDDIRVALTKFQELNVNFEGLQVTGECDNITVKVMNMPRCGCEDIVKGDKAKMMPQNLQYGPLEYRTGSTKWGKRQLTWYVAKYPRNNRHLTNSQVDDAMRRGLQIWADKTKLTFRKVSGTPADIVIKFERLRHTSQPPFYDFDGKGNVLAHAFFPESGVVHFDDDEHFVLNSNTGTELYIVAAHEFGHTLGISHSNIKDALMAPYYRYSEILKLHPDDIAAVQSMYGPPDTAPQPTPAPTRPPPPTEAPDLPSYCDITISASFKIGGVTYMFSRERVSRYRRMTYVYKVTDEGIQSPKMEISSLFVRKAGSDSRYRPYPYRVDAAAYIPHKRYVFLFLGTRAYRYTKGNDNLFTLDEDAGFPKWMNIREFPERPRAAVAMPYRNYNSYYMLIFGNTMVWDWNFYNDRVGAWAYPINVFGRNMPQRFDAAYLQDRQYAVFVKGDKYWKFSLTYRRVLENDDNRSVKKELFKQGCM